MIKRIKKTSFVNKFLKLSRTSIYLYDKKDKKDQF
jgi:predicted transcriptional regulator YheO